MEADANSAEILPVAEIEREESERVLGRSFKEKMSEVFVNLLKAEALTKAILGA